MPTQPGDRARTGERLLPALPQEQRVAVLRAPLARLQAPTPRWCCNSAQGPNARRPERPPILLAPDAGGRAGRARSCFVAHQSFAGRHREQPSSGCAAPCSQQLAKQPRAAGGSRPDFLAFVARAGSTPASCQLQRVDWNSPARSCLEPDHAATRRCTRSTAGTICAGAFKPRSALPSRSSFNPQLPHEPLIFVECGAAARRCRRAMLAAADRQGLGADAARPLQGRRRSTADSATASPGLKGVSAPATTMIKRVADELKNELPRAQDVLHLVPPIPGRSRAGFKRARRTKACRRPAPRA